MATPRKIHDALNIRSDTFLRVDTPYGLNKLGFWPGGAVKPTSVAFLRVFESAAELRFLCPELQFCFIIIIFFFCKVKTAFTRDAAEQQPHQSDCGCL